jgi:hypothetical protein
MHRTQLHCSPLYIICIFNRSTLVTDIALIGKNEMEIRKLFVEMENSARKFGLQMNQEKTKCMIVERKNSLKQNKIGHLNIKITNLKEFRISNI